MQTPKVSLILRDQDVTVTNVNISPAEPEIGINSRQVDDFTLKNEAGEVLSWDLTYAEVNAICEAVWDSEPDEEWPDQDDEWPQD